MEIIGEIKKIFEIQKFDSGFKKRELVITTDGPYPQDILIEFIQDKIELLNHIKLSDKVKIFINIRGRQWINSEGITKYFNSIQGWKIDRNDPEKRSSSISSSPLSSDDFDDLPF